MRYLDDEEALSLPGSLVSRDGLIHAPYDLEHAPEPPAAGAFRALAGAPGASDAPVVLNAAREPFTLPYGALKGIQVVNGMGVTLGDSLIGLTALRALRRLNPGLVITLYRPARAPAYVEQLYALAAPLVARRRSLPWPLARLSREAPCIDLGNQLFWPRFASMPMIDFFLWALGADPRAVPAPEKANRWLDDLALPPLPAPWRTRRYALFCPQASTPLRSIPAVFHVALVERVWQAYGLPVLGFGAVDHPHYRDIAAHAADTASFLAWIKGAAFAMTADSAAVHAAAGFAVPTTAFFTTIAPGLRVRDYPACRPVALDLPDLQGMHASGRAGDLRAVEAAFGRLAPEALPLPALETQRAP